MKLDSVVIDNFEILSAVSQPSPMRQISARSHNSLSYRFYGKNLIKCDGKELCSEGGSLTFVPAEIAYTHEVLAPSKQIVAHFTTKESLGDKAEIFTLPARYGIEDAFLDMYKLWEQRPVANSLPAMAAFYSILATLQRNTSPELTREQKLLESSLSYMHKNFREQDFRVNDLYKLAYISPAYYRRVFDKCYGCSPIEYLKNLRINYAKQLLQSGFHTIAEIAELSGYSSYTYFSDEFKKTAGVPPSKYAD